MTFRIRKDTDAPDYQEGEKNYRAHLEKIRGDLMQLFIEEIISKIAWGTSVVVDMSRTGALSGTGMGPIGGAFLGPAAAEGAGLAIDHFGNDWLKSLTTTGIRDLDNQVMNDINQDLNGLANTLHNYSGFYRDECCAQ